MNKKINEERGLILDPAASPIFVLYISFFLRGFCIIVYFYEQRGGSPLTKQKGEKKKNIV